MNLHDEVMFKWDGRWKKGRLIGVYPEFTAAVKVKDDRELEYIVAHNDAVTVAQFERMERDRVKNENEERYGDVIEAWKNGRKTFSEIAEYLGILPVVAMAKLKAAQRRGLL